jgi:hypothetical protein
MGPASPTSPKKQKSRVAQAKEELRAELEARQEKRTSPAATRRNKAKPTSKPTPKATAAKSARKSAAKADSEEIDAPVLTRTRSSRKSGAAASARKPAAVKLSTRASAEAAAPVAGGSTLARVMKSEQPLEDVAKEAKELGASVGGLLLLTCATAAAAEVTANFILPYISTIPGVASVEKVVQGTAFVQALGTWTLQLRCAAYGCCVLRANHHMRLGW